MCARARYSYLEKILERRLEKIFAASDREFRQGYYAQMVAAWLMAETFVCFQYESAQMLTGGCQMDPWTYNKALQKIRECLNSDQAVKDYVKSLKKG
ncbi:MAG: hypothetical protein K2P42_15865 [Lachnospiraceae bacterium]|nr:hypothetical protein [Lachnospiraceae bacterium]